MSKFGFLFFFIILLAVCGAGVFFYEKEVNIIRQQLAQQQQEIELAQTSNIMLEEKLLKKGIIEIDKKKMKNLMSMKYAEKMSLQKLREMMHDDVKYFNETEDN